MAIILTRGRVININKIFIMVVLLFVIQHVDAATFIISNFSGAPVKVIPRWDRGREGAVILDNGKKSKKYDTHGHRVSSILWEQNGKKYTANLDKINSGLMVEREFAILENGNFQHSFVNFPKKMDYGQALVWPPV